MKRRYIVITALCVSALGGCKLGGGSNNLDPNGVPKIKSAIAPVVDGTTMTPDSFYAKYCNTPETNNDNICETVHQEIVVHRMTGRYIPERD